MLLSTLVALTLAAETASPAPAVAPTINQFGLDLFGQLRAQPGNLFFSPASIGVALEMVNVGAAHATATQLDAALHLEGMDREAALTGYGDQLRAWNGLPPTESTLSVVSRAWGASKQGFHPAYLQQLESRLGASVEPMSFAQPEASRRKINAWVSDATHGKIPDLLGPGTVTRNTQLVLTNAAYFLGHWALPFAPAATHPEPFHLESGESPAVPLMHLEHPVRSGELDGVKVLELAYGKGALVFDALLPNDPHGLAELEAHLDAGRLDSLLNALASQKTEVTLPRFTLRSRFVLNTPLQALGITDAFTPQADFSAMSSGHDLQISQVIHQAFVQTDETGTEAAAATGVVVRSRIARRERTFVFRADHPFLFLIRDARSGAVLFLGRVADPRP